MPSMENKVTLDGFLMKAPRESSKGDQRIARFEIAHHWTGRGGHHQFFAKVVCYGKTADFVLEADFRKGDIMRVDGKCKGFKYQEKGFKGDKYGLEIMGNSILIIKKGKGHPEGGDERDIGLPEGT